MDGAARDSTGRLGQSCLRSYTPLENNNHMITSGLYPIEE